MKYIKVKLSKLYGFKLYPLMLWNIFLKILMYEDMYELRKHWICLCTEYIFDFLISQADSESLVPRDSFFFCLHYSLKFAFFVTIIFLSLLQYCLCFVFLQPQGMWDVNSQTKDWTITVCLGRQGLFFFFFFLILFYF